MPGAVGYGVRPWAYAGTKGSEEADEDPDGGGFGLGVEEPNDLTGEPVVGGRVEDGMGGVCLRRKRIKRRKVLSLTCLGDFRCFIVSVDASEQPFDAARVDLDGVGAHGLTRLGLARAPLNPDSTVSSASRSPRPILLAARSSDETTRAPSSRPW